MEMFLMVACIAVFGLAVTCIAFGAATRSEEQPAAEPAQPEVVKAQPATRFFADHAASDRLAPGTVMTPGPAYARVPIEALLLQIENHVRLEQAAAESFLESPTSALLHSKTMSTLIQ